jgi:two-component system sensor histidine kinase QseC
MKKSPSLRSQLIKSLCLPITVALCIVGLLAFVSSSDEIDEAYNSQLLTSSNILWLLIKNNLRNQPSEFALDAKNIDLGNMPPKDFEEYIEWRSFRIWKDNQIFLASDNAPPVTMPHYAKGFSTFEYDRSTWHVYALYVPDQDVVVEVFEKDDARKELINKIMIGLLWPLLLSLPVIAFLIWKGISFGLRDLRAVIKQVEARSPEELPPLTKDNVLTDLLPLVSAVNTLLSKLGASFERERQFTDNAAHELRTPLSVLKIQAQIAKRSTNDTERNEALSSLLEGVDRSSRLIDQLLLLARLENDCTPLVQVAPDDIICTIVSEMEPSIRDKKIEVIIQSDPLLIIHSKPELLAILFRNIFDNAIKYSPEQGTVLIKLYPDNSRIYLEIIDSGCGIPEDERDKIFQRFYRQARNRESGSGLGLSIVKQITELLEADIEIFTPDSKRGTGVRVGFIEVDRL